MFGRKFLVPKRLFFGTKNFLPNKEVTWQKTIGNRNSKVGNFLLIPLNPYCLVLVEH